MPVDVLLRWFPAKLSAETLVLIKQNASDVVTSGVGGIECLVCKDFDDTVIEVNNADLKLKPGMTANVSIMIAHKDNVLQLKNAALRYRPVEAVAAEAGSTSSRSGAQQGRSGPPGAVQKGAGGRERRTGERTVYVLSGGHPKPAQIKTGISDGVVTEVVEGLEEGDRVVTAEMTSTAAASSPPANPFGGPRRFP